MSNPDVSEFDTGPVVDVNASDLAELVRLSGGLVPAGRSVGVGRARPEERFDSVAKVVEVGFVAGVVDRDGGDGGVPGGAFLLPAGSHSECVADVAG